MLHSDLAEADLAELPEFCETALAERYSPMLAGALKFQADALKIDRSALKRDSGTERGIRQREMKFAEAFPTDYGIVAIEVLTREGTYRQTSEGQMIHEPGAPELTLYGIGSEQIREPLNEIGNLVAERFRLQLSSTRYTNQTFSKLQEEGRTPPTKPTPEEEANARLLSDSAIRQAARGIASSGGLLRQDLAKHLGEEADRSEEIERKLRESPLVEVELVVTCKGKSTQVARAPSREALEQMAGNGLKCACGRDILKERIDEALTLTEHGREMLNGSYWMTVLVASELLDIGVELDRMLIEQVAGGDEMDFFVDVSGDLVLMELKDKEFNLGNAYSFGSKTGIFQPRYPVIVTSAYVGKDAKDHFDQAASARRSASRFGEPESMSANITYIEGLEDLRPKLEQLVERPWQQDATAVLGRVLPSAVPTGQSVVAALKSSSALAEVTCTPAAEQAQESVQPSETA